MQVNDQTQYAQETQYEQQDPGQMQYGSGSISPYSQGTINNQILDTSKLIEQLDRLLRGYILEFKMGTDNPPTWKTGKPLLPEQMINKLMTYIQARYNPGTPLGYLTEKDANRFTYDFCVCLAKWLRDNYEENNPDMDTKDFNLILSTVEFMTFNILTRAIKGKTQEGIFNIGRYTMPNVPGGMSGYDDGSQSSQGGGFFRTVGRKMGLP